MSRRKGECVVCYLGLDKDGYSGIWLGPKQGGRNHRTHRVIMHLLAEFDLDSKEIILHDDSKCKSKACIEFNHLRVGTVSENAVDREIKQGYGNKKGHVKTTCERHPNAERGHNNAGKSYCKECHKEAQQKYLKNKTQSLLKPNNSLPTQEKRG